MVEERHNYIYVAEADPEAVARTVRRLQLLLLPRSVDYARADDLFAQAQPEEPPPGGKGLLNRLFRKGAYRGLDFDSPQIPTPVSRYVGLMLLQMLEDGPPTRAIKRSEPLPALTFKTDTADPPPLEDVLNHFKGKCGINIRKHSGPTDGTISIGIQGTPCQVWCRFNDAADTCCEIRLEPLAE